MNYSIPFNKILTNLSVPQTVFSTTKKEDIKGYKVQLCLLPQLKFKILTKLLPPNFPSVSSQLTIWQIQLVDISKTKSVIDIKIGS